MPYRGHKGEKYCPCLTGVHCSLEYGCAPSDVEIKMSLCTGHFQSRADMGQQKPPGCEESLSYTLKEWRKSWQGDTSSVCRGNVIQSTREPKYFIKPQVVHKKKENGQSWGEMGGRGELSCRASVWICHLLFRVSGSTFSSYTALPLFLT